MKKFVTIIATVIAAVTMMSLNVSASGFIIPAFTDISVFHQHEYVEEVIAPDCTNDGIVVYTCECGDTYNEKTSDALGHNYSDWSIVVMPTMDVNGTEMHECNVCGLTETRDYVCEHIEVSDVVIKDSTCQNEGIVQTICDMCSKVMNENTVPVSAHEFGEWKTIKNASPNHNGEKSRSCACGMTETKVVEFEMAGKNSVYIASAGINTKYVVASFTQEAVDNNDVICNYTRLNANNPIILGHNTGSLKKLYNTKIGSYIYLNVDGVTHTYKVQVSEPAVETENNTELQGINTGYELLDNYSGESLRLYTCYQHKELGKIRWIVMAEKIS